MNLHPRLISTLLPNWLRTVPQGYMGHSKSGVVLYLFYSSQITLLFLFTNLLRDSCNDFFELLQLCQNARFLILRQ